MSKAAGKTLEDHCEMIVKSLLKGALWGNAHSTGLLFSLADGESASEAEGVMRTLRSLASELASEPEWKGEDIEASSAGEAAAVV